ncbi:hypothetical protein BD410DRAFT_735567, partial [Rickenella mellea]
SGVVHLVRAWHQIGHPDEAPTVSKDYIWTCGQAEIVGRLIRDLGFISKCMNALTEAIDADFAKKLKILREKVIAASGFADALSSIDPLLMEGRCLIFNRRTTIHRDESDPPEAWALLFVVGSFKGGSMHFPELGLRVRFLPGDVIAMRGQVLEHEVEVWGGHIRISVVHFTHASLSDYFDMEL